MSAAIEQLIEELRIGARRPARNRAGRRTRRVLPGALRGARAGAGSLRDDPTDLTKQPVPRVLAERGGQVVQEDAAAAFPDDPGFHEMRERYGGMRAQIVTGCYRDGVLVALLSIHDLHAPRRFGDAERERCRSTAAEIARMLDGVA